MSLLVYSLCCVDGEWFLFTAAMTIGGGGPAGLHHVYIYISIIYCLLGGLYATYHLLREPETTIEKIWQKWNNQCLHRTFTASQRVSPELCLSSRSFAQLIHAVGPLCPSLCQTWQSWQSFNKSHLILALLIFHDSEKPTPVDMNAYGSYSNFYRNLYFNVCARSLTSALVELVQIG